MMKKMLIICCMVLSWSAKGQIFVNNQNLDSIPDLEYIFVSWNIITGKVTVNYGADYGRILKRLDDGTQVKFPSEVDCLNYFYKNGWELRSHLHDDAYVLQRRKIK